MRPDHPVRASMQRRRSGPPGRATRTSSPAATAWRGANITPKQLVTRSNDASANGSSSASPSTSSISTAGRCRPPALLLEQLRRQVEAGHLRAGLRGGDRHVARARRHIEQLDPRTGAGTLSDVFADRHDPLRDLGVVARRPHRLLPFLDRTARRCSSFPLLVVFHAHAIAVRPRSRCGSIRQRPATAEASSSSGQRSAPRRALVIWARALQRHRARVVSDRPRIL